MHLLSLETAKALKEAGLKWEPVLGDLFVADYDNGLGPTPVDVVKTNNFGEPGPEYMWLPHLGQLWVEIEAQGYDWFLKTDYCYVVNNKNQAQGIYADTPVVDTSKGGGEIMPSLETAKALKGEPIHYEYQNTPKGAGGNDGVGRNNF